MKRLSRLLALFLVVLLSLSLVGCGKKEEPEEDILDNDFEETETWDYDEDDTESTDFDSDSWDFDWEDTTDEEDDDYDWGGGSFE